jgi:TonB family protein
VRVKTEPPPEPLPEPAFGIVFEGEHTDTKGVPKPGKFVQIPEGQDSPQPTPTPPRAAPPPTPPSAKTAPEVNLLPPEYAQQFQPPPPQDQAEAVPHPAPQEKPSPARHAQQQQRQNPFAHPMVLSFAPAMPRPHRGLSESKSLDLSMGPVFAGGQMHDAVAHVSNPGASGDYLAEISAYVERHKFYPSQAAANGENGVATIDATITRDGRVVDVRLRQSSGSRWLDMAWESLFRDHRFSPFTDDMKGDKQIFTLTMDYELIYH